ncbi:MAG TPA: hypothetical protein VH475_23970 [Tepidisphaeraceae bacterium]|jgi:hypothetical protein
MIRLGLIALIVAVGFAALPVRPASAHRGTYIVQAGRGLNLRTCGSGSCARIETMANGTLFKARGHRGAWMYGTSRSSGKTGWAWLAYLSPYSGGGGGSTSGPQRCFWNFWSRTVCAEPWVAEEFWAAAKYYGASYDMLMLVGACESDLLPNAYNPISGVTGIMQFEWSTIQAFGWPGANPWSVHDSAWVAAKMFREGLGWTHWHCYRLITGGEDARTVCDQGLNGAPTMGDPDCPWRETD